MAPLPEQIDVSQIGYASKVQRNEATGSRTVYMSMNKEQGFSRAQNLAVQCCSPDTPMTVQYDLSEPMQGNKSRYSLDVDVPQESPMYKFLVDLNQKTREEVRNRAEEFFPRMKTKTMSDDQLNMCYIPCFKTDDKGGPGRLKLKVIMPVTPEEMLKLSPQEIERRRNDASEVIEVTHYQTPSESGEGGVFEHAPSDPSILRAGCKVMPLITTAGIWLNDSQCGVSFVTTSICVWRAPSKSGVSAFNLGAGVTIKAGLKRVREEDEAEGVSSPPSYVAYGEGAEAM
tara:strand:- start:51 stop:908 length:858 start_codon:yes stop_codon:yes gene_type:complete